MKKYLSQEKCKDYKKLLVDNGYTVGVDNVPMQDEYEEAFES